LVKWLYFIKKNKKGNVKINDAIESFWERVIDGLTIVSDLKYGYFFGRQLIRPLSSHSICYVMM
jgi:hypothetical protein